MGEHQVLFSGESKPGKDAGQVMADMAILLGIDARKAARLFTGRTVVLKSQLSFEEATTLKVDLETLGAVCRIKDMGSRQGTPGLKSDARIHDQTLHDITAAHHECPRCGYLQLETEHCSRCGVDITAATKQKRKEDLIIEKKIRLLHEKSEPATSKVDPGSVTPIRSDAKPQPTRSSPLRRLFGGRKKPAA